MEMRKRDIARLGPAAQRQILEEMLKAQGGGASGTSCGKRSGTESGLRFP